jgi:signal transduction histidine kinase/CheY-like chemotaxis protein
VFEVGKKNKVFSRYNTAIIGVFIFIVFSALSVATYRYYDELAQFKKIEIDSLSQQIQQLDDALSANVDALKSIQKFANYYLKYPEELPTKTPSLTQDGENYYVERRSYDVIEHKEYVRNNITGVGDVTQIGESVKAEIAMANMLTPAFVTAKKANNAAVWYYYASLQHFVSIYPSINRNSWQYSPALVSGEHANSIIEQKAGDHVLWSNPYVDSSGVGLNTSLGLGVVNKGYVSGILYADISLLELQKHFKALDGATSNVVLINENQDVLIHHSSAQDRESITQKWTDIAPDGLAHQSFDNLRSIQVIGDWLVQKQTLPVTGWTVLKYQSYKDFCAPLLSHFVFGFLILFVGLLMFLVFVYWLTHRTFIEPTQRFISHIEYSAQGDPGKIKPTNDWLHWFQVVENIFGQNRSLLQRLTEHNTLLDTRVNEKTKALQDKIVQHKRDYALLRSVMNAIPEYILFNDTEGRIVGFNKAFGHFIKKDEREVLGKKSNEIIVNELGEMLTELSVSDSAQSGLQRVVQTVDNTYDVFCTNIYSDTGIDIGTIDIIRDVTVQYETQAVLEKTKNQAEFANKAKSQFLANMSHEIRTPINAIQGMITLLGRSALNNNQRQHIDNAYGASKSLLYLVDQLLDLAKIESGEMTIVNALTSLDSIVDKAIKLNIGMANNKKLNLEVEIAPDVPPFIETDEMRLIQVITNLLHNSVKFTHEGEIKLVIRVFSKDEHNINVRITINDTGIGIAKNKQANLFEAFKQADDSMTREYGGSGLGLSICQEIIHLLGGQISLKSELNQGCQFTVDLPFKVQHKLTGSKVQSKPLTICNYGIYLPDSVIDSMHWLGWDYHKISQLSDVARLSESRDLVVLMSEGNLDDLVETPYQQFIELLCICQPRAYGMNTQEVDLLDKLSVPYILQEHPLYRQMLCYINKSIYRLNQSKTVGSEVENDNLEGVDVLLVEDNLVNQLVAKELLESMKAQVVIVENGQLAIDMLENNSFDIVLMDIQMPVMDGLTASKLIREKPQYADLPIIAMTAHARKEDRENSMQAGMNLHMAKPVKYETLLSSIKGLLS